MAVAMATLKFPRIQAENLNIQGSLASGIRTSNCFQLLILRGHPGDVLNVQAASGSGHCLQGLSSAERML